LVQRANNRSELITAMAWQPDARCPLEPVPTWDQRIWLVAVALVLVVVAAFLPVLENGFVNWDDSGNFLDNPHFRGLGGAQVKWAWTAFWMGAYQPLAWLFLEAQFAIWGLDPRGYHLTSLFLHAANAVVLYVLTLTVLVRCRADARLRNPWACALGAGLASALFAVHPLRVEAVAWASCQPYLLCALFSMLAVLAYLRATGAAPSAHWRWLVSSWVLLAAALLSKAVAVSLPAVLLILDVYPLRRLGGGPGRWFGPSARKVWYEKVPFFLLSLDFMGLAIAAKARSHTIMSIQHASLSARMAQACYAIWFYLVKTVLPLEITAYYPVPEPIDWFAPEFRLAILGTLVVSVALILMIRRRPGLLAAWLSYLIILAPNSGLVRIGDLLGADRYSYLAMMGGVMVAAAGLGRAWQTSWGARRGAVGTIAICLGTLTGLMLLTRDQCRIWRTSKALWTHALDHGASRSAMAHNNLGLALFQGGELAEAEGQFVGALQQSPGYVPAYNNLGLVLARQGRLAEAAAYYSEALRREPNYVKAYNNLGLVRLEEGKLAEAAALFAEALRRDPHNSMARCCSGLVLYKQGRLNDAITELSKVLRQEPDNTIARANLGAALGEQGRLDEAISELSEVLRHEPDNEVARSNLGAALYKQGQFEEAERLFRRILARQPENTGALKTLAWLLALRDRESAPEALELINRAIGGVGALPSLVDTRAVVLIRAGRFDQALFELGRARVADPRNPSLAIHMAWAYQARGRLDEARRAFRQARELGWRPNTSDPLERPLLDQLGRELTSGAAAMK
jgi:tetratricopeptide (TPR) repeat protein